MQALDQLAVAWSAAKDREEDARNERISIEEAILMLHPAREEGSQTIVTPAGAKIITTGKITYKADVDKLTALTGDWPEEAKPIKVEIKADDSKLKAIRNDRPDLWKRIAPAIETKPAKTGVSIKFREEGSV